MTIKELLKKNSTRAHCRRCGKTTSWFKSSQKSPLCAICSRKLRLIARLSKI